MITGLVNMSPPNRKRRENSPFTDDVEIWITLQYGAFRSVIQVQRSFRRRYEVLSANAHPIWHLTSHRCWETDWLTDWHQTGWWQRSRDVFSAGWCRSTCQLDPRVSCLFFWFWGVSMDKVVKCKPESWRARRSSQLLCRQSGFGGCGEGSAARLPQAEACLNEQGANFEGRQKKRNTKGQWVEVASKMNMSQLFCIKIVHSTGTY